MKLFLSQWNFYSRAETIPRRKVSAWLYVWHRRGGQRTVKPLPKVHNETIPKWWYAEKPCTTSIFAKRKRLIVSDTLVSKLSTLFGRSDRTRTCNWDVLKKWLTYAKIWKKRIVKPFVACFEMLFFVTKMTEKSEKRQKIKVIMTRLWHENW